MKINVKKDYLSLKIDSCCRPATRSFDRKRFYPESGIALLQASKMPALKINRRSGDGSLDRHLTVSDDPTGNRPLCDTDRAPGSSLGAAHQRLQTLIAQTMPPYEPPVSIREWAI